MHILKEGDKVGASDATLLNMLNISPFNYGLLVEMVYDSGTIFEPKILDIKPEDLRVKFIEVIHGSHPLQQIFHIYKLLNAMVLYEIICSISTLHIWHYILSIFIVI